MTDIKIGIVVDSTGARRGASEVNASLSEVEKRSKAVGRAIGAALAAFGSIETVRKIAQINDEYAKVEGRLKLVTQGTDQLRATQEQLFQIAQRTGSAYTSVADLYTKVARNAGVLGLAQQQLYDLTTLTNQAIQVGGASASEASAGVIQFSQALASGQLRGDEFRSVMENMPRLANAISDGLGVTIGDLRNLANNGKLTAEVVTQALLSQKDKLASEFSQLPVTVGRSMQQLENAVQRAIADADVSALTTSIADLTKTVSDPRLVSGIADLAGGLLKAAAAAVDLVKTAAEFRGDILAAAFVAGSVAAGRYASSLAAAVAAKAADIYAAQQQIAVNTAASQSWANLTRAQATQTAATLANVDATLAAVTAARSEYAARLQQAHANVAAADATLAAARATGAQAEASGFLWRAEKQLTAAIAERSIATQNLANLGRQQAALEAELAAATAANTAAQARAAAATSAAAASVAAAGAGARVAAAGFGVLRGALAFVGGPIGALVAGGTLLATWLLTSKSNSDALAQQLPSTSRSLKELADEANRLRSGGALLSPEQTAALEEGRQHIQQLAQAMMILAAARDAAAAAGDGIGASAQQAEMDRLARMIQQISDQMRSVSGPTQAAKASIDALDQAVVKANENVQRQVDELRLANAMILKGVDADEAATRAKATLDGVSKSRIDSLIREKRANDDLRQSLDDLKQSVEDYTRAQMEAESLAHDVSDLQRQIELVRSGLSVDQARLAIQEQRLALQAQFNAENEVSHDQNVALLELEKLRAEQTLSALDDSQKAAKQTADEAAKAYQRASEEINRSLTDALLRGFESGKGFAENFRDTLKNMFETLVLRPTISFIIDPVAQGLNGALAKASSGFASGGLASGEPAAGGVAASFAALNTSLTASTHALGGLINGGVTSQGLIAAAPAIGAALAAGFIGYQAGRALTTSGSNISANTQGLAVLATGGWSLAASAIDKITGGSLFGTHWKVKSQEIAIEFLDGLADATLTTVEKKKKSLFRGTKKRTSTDDLEDLDAQIGDTFSGIYDAVSKAGDALGFTISDFKLKLDASIKGLSDDEIQQKITELLTGATDALVQQTVPGIEAFQTADEALIDTLTRVANETTIVTQAADAMGLSFGTLAGLDLAGVADNIIALSGGIDQFGSNVSAYLQGFYSDDERTAILADQLNQQLATLGDTLPDTRDGFRALIDGLDVTTEAGQQALATLLGLAGQADAYYDAQEAAAQKAAEAMQKAADDQLAALNDAVKSHTAEFNDAVSQYKDGIEQITKTLQDQLDDISAARGNIGDAVLNVRRSAGFDEVGYQRGLIDTLRGQIGSGSIDDQIGTVTSLTKAIQDRYSAELQDINSARSAAESLYSTQQQAVEAMRDALKGLKDYADSLKLSELSPLTNAARLDEARKQYGNALLQAQRGSDPATISALQAAAGAYLTEARSYNASSTDYTGIFDSVQSELNRVAGRSVSAGLPPNTGVYDQQIADLQGKAVNELLGLQDVLDDISAQANEQAVTQTEMLTMTFEQSASDIIARLAKASADAAAQISEQLADAREQARQIGADNIAALQAVYTSIIQTGSATVAAISAIPPPPSTAKVA